MIAEATRRSPLADYADRFSALWAATKGELAIRELPFSSQVNLRADPNDAELMQRLTRSLGGLALPIVPNTVNAVGDRRALWLGPDEWLIVGPENQQEPISEALPVGLEGGFGSIVDTSANRTVLEIRGAGARELLSHGVPIDLDAPAFGPGQCAQTLLAKAQVTIEHRDESGFHIYTRTSFASYVANWLLDAAAE